MVSLKIAIIGTRGVPPVYGGFETFAGELGPRLVARGHHVTVYCRRGLPGESRSPHWRGVDRVVLPAFGHKYLETVTHTALSSLDALRRGFDAVLVCNAANAFVLPLLRAARVPVAINVDGVERKRRKWNVLGRTVYAVGEAFSVLYADRVVADAEVIASYYRERFQAPTVVIPYGADFPPEEDSDILERLGVRAKSYVLYVSRFEPENNPLEVVLAWEHFRSIAGAVGEGVPLIMVGSGKYAPSLVAALHRHEGASIRFPGAVYGQDYRTLQRNALFYVQATEVGGTHPALIEAMGSGGCVLANDTPENREVGGDAVTYFRLGSEETLSGAFLEYAGDEGLRERMRAAAKSRVARLYQWDVVTDAYERLFREMAGRA